MTVIINTLAEAKQFAKTAVVGSAWGFGGWPTPILDEDPDEYDALMDKARKLETECADVINAAVADEVVEVVTGAVDFGDSSEFIGLIRGMSAKAIADRFYKRDVVAAILAFNDTIKVKMGLVDPLSKAGREDVLAQRLLDGLKIWDKVSVS